MNTPATVELQMASSILAVAQHESMEAELLLSKIAGPDTDRERLRAEHCHDLQNAHFRYGLALVGVFFEKMEQHRPEPIPVSLDGIPISVGCDVPLPCGHYGFSSIYNRPDGTGQCTMCANRMRGLRG